MTIEFQRLIIARLVPLVAVWLLALVSLYLLHGGQLDLSVSKRSLDANKTTPPRTAFPPNYHATGRLFLPHSKIVEPFEVWFSKDLNRSRIDYYYGTDKTYQRADLGHYGVTFKVVPMYTEKRGNYIGCWSLEGHKGWPIIPQPIVPNMSYFQFAGEEVYMGTHTTRWEYRYMAFDMLNAHTLWVSKLDAIRPVRYEMKGYDSLLASYYDNYVLEYISFEEWTPDVERFELPKDQWCYNWSHTLDSHLVSNPMGEFMSHGQDTVEDVYNTYKQHHNKSYDSKHENVKRKHIFRHNMRYIRSINRQNLTYKLAPNHLVDLTDEEYDGHAGLKDDNTTHHKGAVHLGSHHEAYSNMSSVLKTIDVPDELDWRDYGAVTPVRGQGICGSCYALGAVGAVEGAYFMKTGRLVELSAQQVIDCSWGSGNHGCRGGWYNKALSWIYLNGVATAKNYGPYLAQEGTCITCGLHERVNIDAFAFVPKYNNTALKRAIAKYGPACVSINQKPLSLKFYSWGVYDNPECDNSSTLHTVLVVGYGEEKGVPYWLVKNSWSASWGIDGYIKLAWKGNTCGVTKNPVVALMRHTTFQFPVKERIRKVDPFDPDSLGRKIHAQHRPRPHGNKNGSSNLNSSFHDKQNGSTDSNSISSLNKAQEDSTQNASRKTFVQTKVDRTFKIKNLNMGVDEVFTATYFGYTSREMFTNQKNFGNGNLETGPQVFSEDRTSKRNKQPTMEPKSSSYSHSVASLTKTDRKGNLPTLTSVVNLHSAPVDIHTTSNVEKATSIRPSHLLNEQTALLEPTTKPTTSPSKTVKPKTSTSKPTTSKQTSTLPPLQSTAKPGRHFYGKLQDIYDQLERVISGGMNKAKRNRRLKKLYKLG